jgi:hypothetical protein
MAQRKPTVLVLWGNFFDECATVAFVCELRALGVRVRVVGLDGRLARGRHGLVLGADLSIDRILLQRLSNTHIVVPCLAEQWPQLLQNPLACRLLAQARADRALVIVPDAVALHIEDQIGAAPAADPTLPLGEVFFWGDEEPAGAAARRLATLLHE